jgi:hypothetical protein
MTRTRSVQPAKKFGEILFAPLFHRRRECSPECGSYAGMCGRNIDANDSAVHVDIRRTIGSTLRIHGPVLND